MATAKQLEYEAGQARVFEGVYREQMPELLRAGFNPATPAEIMDKRTAGNEFFIEDYITTSTGCAVDSNRVYLIPRSASLRSVTPVTKLVSGGIPLDRSREPTIQEFSRKDHILDRPLTEKEALEHKLWLSLADNDQDRHARYVEKMFRLGKDRFGYNKMLGLYVTKDKSPIVRGLILDRLEGGFGADGVRYLDNYDARLFGVRRDEVAPKN